MGAQLAKSRPMRARLSALAFAFCTTLIALPSVAVTIPDVPLQSGSAYPPANVMFILDDSGSMAWDFMPGAFGSGEVPTTSPVNVGLTAYTRNTLYYNPSLTYLPWVKADDTRYTGGTTYAAAYDDDSQLSGNINLGSSTRTFYAPKDGATNFGATSSYYRYQITPGGGSMIRSEYDTVAHNINNASGFPRSVSDTNTNNTSTTYTFNVPAGTKQLVVSSSGGTKGTNGSANNNNGNGADLYLRYNAVPSTSNYDCASTGGTNAETCVIDDPTAGTWQVNFRANSSFRSVTVAATLGNSNACSGMGTNGGTDWVNCTAATPQYRDANNALVNRTLANELANYAVWYSYHRTRIKTAKAGASEAFSRLAGSSLRVGYNSIWNRSPLNIPVGTNNGVFSGSNRTNWFNTLHAADASNGTPLKGALRRAGDYFSNTSASGPWGPESGANQLSCRQNFAILTTDGYWNDNTNYTDNIAGDADGTAGPTITGPNSQSYTYALAKPYIDNFSGTNNTRANTLADVAMYYWKRDLHTALTNNVPTSLQDPAFWQHMVTFGVSIGLQGNLTPPTDLVSITNGSKRWGDPTDNEDADRIDDLWHASVNGRGNFVTAKNPTEFANGLIDALATVAARLGSASNVVANSTSISTDSRLYQATYVSGKWIGELSAYDVSSAGLAATPAWRTSTSIAYSGRKVFTWGGSAGTTFPTAAQITALNRTTGIAPIDGTSNANYVKGDSTLERRVGGTLRSRETLLGDIVNSSPAYSNDTKTIFVGANDGMLHAVNALNGRELWGFVPGNLNFANLAMLSDPQYTHKYFVDGPVVVSSYRQTPAKNILVGTLGRGGKGAYALDVTTPSTFAASNAMWQITDNGGDMGMVIGEPLIVTLNDASQTKAVLIPNGINSTNGHSVLFVVNLMTGAIIKKIDTGVGGDNGLFDPRGRDNDGNGTVDWVYAADKAGNVWKFDFSGATSGSWGITPTNTPLYTTPSGQAITSGIALGRDPLTGKPWIFFGTGSYLSISDVSDATVQTMYGIIDEGVKLTESQLQERRIGGTTVRNGVTYRALQPTSPLPAGKKGWFLKWNNPTNGERVVSRPQFVGAAIVVSTIIPPAAVSCEAGGSGFITAFDPFTGTARSEPFFDMTGDNLFNSSDTINVTMPANDPMDPVGTAPNGGQPGENTGTTATGTGSVQTPGGNPGVGVQIGDLYCVGLSDGSRKCYKINPGGGQPRRVMWREILRD